MPAELLHSCPTLCKPMDSLPARLLYPWDSPGKDIGVGCHFLLQSFKRLRMNYNRPESPGESTAELNKTDNDKSALTLG